MKSKINEGLQHGFIDDASQYQGNYTPEFSQILVRNL